VGGRRVRGKGRGERGEGRRGKKEEEKKERKRAKRGGGYAVCVRVGECGGAVCVR